MLSKFIREEGGSIVPIFAASLVPILALAGASVDLAEMTRAQRQLQAAVDSTALSINHELHTSSVQANLQTEAQQFFAAQVTELDDPHLDPVTFDVGGGRVQVAGTAVFKPSVMQAVGFGPFTLRARSVTVVGDQEIEVAMVLDNSGSMQGTKISSLKAAANSLVTTLFATQTAHTRVKIGIVPFSGAVNVGPSNKNQNWMDRNGLSPIHSENFSKPANRFTLFSEMNSTNWAGCVEVRPGDHGITDSLPNESDPETLFVPMFAPDERDDPQWGNNPYTNNYLSDGGSNCTEADTQDTSTAGRQGRVCKYKGKTPSTSSTGSTNKGPNFWCNSKPIVPLTNDTNALTTALNAMAAKGYTNIHEGLMWGWRVLSPTEPFTEGKTYETPNLHKYIVLMTDGENTMTGRGSDTINKSEYSAYGYSVKNRLGTTSGSSSTLQSKMDDKLKAACENAKDQGIDIYTIAFQVSDDDTKEMLEECATTPSMAFRPAQNSDLVPVFQAIARDLGKLRIVE